MLRIKIISPVVRMPEEELELDRDTSVEQLSVMVTQRLPDPDNIKVHRMNHADSDSTND